jgi:dihydropyrimidine dehydrogenase (NAD+) subunit PreA
MARPDAGHHIGQKFSLIEKFTRAAKRAVNIPVIAKMTPNITDMLPAALAAQEGGADGISAINTVKSISHVNIDEGLALPDIRGRSSVSGFSGKGCRHIGLRFVSELARDRRLRIPISGMGGIYTWRDGAEYLQLGASNLQVTTAAMQHGYRIIEDLTDGLGRHLTKNGWSSVHDLVGRANGCIVDPSQLDNQLEVLSHVDPAVCIGCGACEVACRDGAAQAISMLQTRASRVAIVNEKSCVGCKLCEIVCPVNAITFSTRPRIERPRFSKLGVQSR